MVAGTRWVVGGMSAAAGAVSARASTIDLVEGIAGTGEPCAPAAVMLFVLYASLPLSRGGCEALCHAIEADARTAKV